MFSSTQNPYGLVPLKTIRYGRGKVLAGLCPKSMYTDFINLISLLPG